MNTYFHRRLNKLKNKCNIPETQNTIVNFQTIIGMDNIPNGAYSIDLTTYETHCDIHIRYTNTLNYFDLSNNNIAELPLEINRLINEYLPSYITLHLQMVLTPNYPFTPPIWIMIECNDYLASSLKNAETYYRNIVDKHNRTNRSDWSPAFTIECDILAFLVRINHFDSLFSHTD
jgi:hypothetical protein